MAFRNFMLAGVSLVVVAAVPAMAQEQTAAADDIVVLGQRIMIGAKDPRPIKDVPQSITVVTREEIELRNLFTLEDVMLATPGITVTGVSSEDEDYLSRGFTIDSYLIDGVPLIGYPGARPDMTVYERVEILRGPSSLFSGAAQPGGAINLVRKRPTGTLAVRGAALAGSWNNFRGEIDAGGPLTAEGGVRARFAASAQDSDMFYDHVKRRRYVAYGIVAFDLTPDITMSVGAHHQTYHAPIQTGLPGYVGGGLLSVRRSTYLGADWNRVRNRDTMAFAEFGWKMTDRLELKVTAQRAKQDRQDNYAYIGNGAVRPGNGWTSQVGYFSQSDSDWTSFDAHVAGKFGLFGRDHNILLGADHQRLDNDYKEWRDRAFARIDVFNPDNAIRRPAYQPNSGGLAKTRQTGIYGNIDLSLATRLTMISGARLSWWERHERGGYTRETPSLTNPKPISLGPWTKDRMKASFRPFGALTYDLTPSWKAYVSYADSLTPQTQRTVEGGTLSPTSGQQWEGGLKGQILDERLLLTAAVYRIKQSGRAIADPMNEGFFIADGEVVSRGAEAAVSGQIMANWLVTGGYAYNTNRYTRDPVNQDLAFTRISPAHSMKLFTNYKIEQGVLDGLAIGGGVNFASRVGAGNARAATSTWVTQSNILTFEGLIGYQFNEYLTLRLNVKNMFDKKYYTRISGTGRGNFYAEPRNFSLALRARW